LAVVIADVGREEEFGFERRKFGHQPWRVETVESLAN
jgi:hypothetical protein